MHDRPSTHLSDAAPRLLAVVVLYRLEAHESVAWQSLRGILQASAVVGRAVEPMLWDNTPGPRRAPGDFSGRFHHDPTNPGLATAYNAALQVAEASGAPWLLLLDQDTTVTAEYLDALLHATATTDAAAVVPHLVHQGHAVSPFLPALSGPVRELSLIHI